MKNHYDYLDQHLIPFSAKTKAEGMTNNLITAHGDKAYGYKDQWEQHGIPFNHGVLLFILTYTWPYAAQVRDGARGLKPQAWVKPNDWVCEHYKEFKNLIEQTETEQNLAQKYRGNRPLKRPVQWVEPDNN